MPSICVSGEDEKASGVESDEALMQRYVEGDAEAFNELFARYEKRIYRFFLSRIRERHRAWDLYQELFLRLHRFRSTYATGARFAPWFFQIARHVLIDEVRRVHARAEYPIEAGSPAAPPSPDALDRLMYREAAAGVLTVLSPEQGSILLRAKLVGESYLEIAERLGRSSDAVKQMASRALRKLRVAAERDLYDSSIG